MMMRTMLRGAGAGLVATAPMTVAMEVLFRLLPWREQYPLPPSQITAELTNQLDLHEDLDQHQHIGLTLVNHFAYGAAAGALYGPFAHALGERRAVVSLGTGIGWGLAVWSISYLEVLPALGLLRPATQHPVRRNVLMIVAHVTWGAALGMLTGRLQRSL